MPFHVNLHTLHSNLFILKITVHLNKWEQIYIHTHILLASHEACLNVIYDIYPHRSTYTQTSKYTLKACVINICVHLCWVDNIQSIYLKLLSRCQNSELLGFFIWSAVWKKVPREKRIWLVERAFVTKRFNGLLPCDHWSKDFILILKPSQWIIWPFINILQGKPTI